MKKIFYFIILFSVSITAQTKIDQFVSIKIPGEVIKLDTISNKIRVENYYSQSGNETFMVQKTKIDSTANELNGLPSDIESLKKTYRSTIDGYLKTLKANNIHFTDSSSFKIDKYLCYNVSCKNLNGTKKIVESTFLILNEDIYIVSYFNLVDFNEDAKNHFLKSLKIDSTSNPSQTIGKPTSYKIGYVMGKIIVFLLIIGIIIYFVRRRKE